MENDMGRGTEGIQTKKKHWRKEESMQKKVS
jgi:hypothetical protein